MSRKLGFAIILALLAAAFLSGYLLQLNAFRKLSLELENHRVLVQRLEARIESLDVERELGELPAMAAQLYVEVNRGHFDTAARLSASYFDRVGRLAETTQIPSLKAALESILSERDNISAELARFDQSARKSTEQLLLYTLAVVQPGE